MKEQIVAFIQHHVQQRPVVLGLSGGVDSSVVASLAVAALGAKNVFGFCLPSRVTAASDVADAQALAKMLNISCVTIPLESIMQSYLHTIPEPLNQLAQANLQARIRMTILYAYANTKNALVLGTGNKTELKVGYFSKYGDGGVDLLPIGHLYKTQVWQLARALNVPETIITKAPTAGLYPGQTDEAELGIDYKTLDRILSAVEQAGDLTQFQPAQVKRVQQLCNQAAHKLRLPPTP